MEELHLHSGPAAFKPLETEMRFARHRGRRDREQFLAGWIFRLAAALAPGIGAVPHLFQIAAHFSSQAPQRIKSRLTIAELRPLLERAIGLAPCTTNPTHPVPEQPFIAPICMPRSRPFWKRMKRSGSAACFARLRYDNLKAAVKRVLRRPKAGGDGTIHRLSRALGL